MYLSLDNLLPAVNGNYFAGRNSDIWQQQLKLESGRIIRVQAPSGSGKTTLLHFLYGLRNDYSGGIFWDGKDLKSISSEELAQLRAQQVSIVFQDLRLFPNLTVFENLELKRRLTNTIPESEMNAWLIRLGIPDVLQQTASTLSLGEQQRVAIIRSLLQPFQWLIMDEPFSHLDTKNILAAASLISEQREKYNAGILVTALGENDFFDYTETIYL